jgi:hypothetical protein
MPAERETNEAFLFLVPVAIAVALFGLLHHDVIVRVVLATFRR